MRLILLFVATSVCLLGLSALHLKKTKVGIQLPVWHADYQTQYQQPYHCNTPDESDLKDIQCPIPMGDRVPNYTGSQCVFSSLECLGRWAECKQLIDPLITSRPECQGPSSPVDVQNKLKKFGVKFEQSFRDRKTGIDLIKKAMAEGRGCLWGVPGHAMVLCHYDEENNVIKWIDNSDRNLKVQTNNIDYFNKRWDGWVVVIYAEKDLFPFKTNNLANQIPIIDLNNPQGVYPKDYIPMPK